MSANLLLAVPLGLLGVGFYWTTQFRAFDFEGEYRSPSLAARLGWNRASLVLDALVVSAFLVLAVLPSLGAPQGVWFGVAALPFATGAARKFEEQRDDPEASAPCRQMMMQSLFIFALAAVGGIFVSAV